VRRIGQEGVGSLSRGLLSRLDKSGEARERSRVISAWRLVAGPEVYSHARGFALRGEELVVFVDTYTWATELSAMQEHYKAALNMVIGKETVATLRFAVSKKVTEDKGIELQQESEGEPDRALPVEPVSASRLERDQVRLMTAGIHDERIREAVIAARIAHLEWRKGTEARNAAEKALQRLREADSSARG
jgi:hypothetical protein